MIDVAILAERIRECQNCELRQGCRSPIPLLTPLGIPERGSSTPVLTNTYAILGESPGRVEDLKGKHHVGPAGRYLRREMKKAGLDPASAYYFNAVSCWPRGRPKTDHLMACRQNLIDQWNVVDAKFVLVLGKTALDAVLPHATKHTRDRVIPIHDKVIFPVHHPSYVMLSRDPVLQHAWVESLKMFALVIGGWADYGWNECTYCRKPNPPACKGEHMGWWRSDQTWKMPPPPQLTLEID